MDGYKWLQVFWQVSKMSLHDSVVTVGDVNTKCDRWVDGTKAHLSSSKMGVV